MKQEDALYHTSSISETAEVLQNVLDKISKEEQYKEFSDVEVTESIRDVWRNGKEWRVEHEASCAIGRSF